MSKQDKLNIKQSTKSTKSTRSANLNKSTKSIKIKSSINEKNVLKKFGYSNVKQLSDKKRHIILYKINNYLKNSFIIFKYM